MKQKVNEAASMLGKRGGAVNKKKGSEYFQKLNQIRWDRMRAKQIASGDKTKNDKRLSPSTRKVGVSQTS